MNDESHPVRILIADDHAIFRAGLRKLLESEPGFEVVGEAADGAAAARLVRQLNPDILLLDLAMPRGSGLEVLHELAQRDSPVFAVLLTAAIDKKQILEALQLGARGVVLKEAATELLFRCIRTVMGGQYWVGRDSVSSLVRALRGLMPTPGEGARRKKFGLTPRELEVVAAVVAGYTNRDMAEKFSISEQTVKHHLSNAFDKLGVSTRLELALFAVNHHLVENL